MYDEYDYSYDEDKLRHATIESMYLAVLVDPAEHYLTHSVLLLNGLLSACITYRKELEEFHEKLSEQLTIAKRLKEWTTANKEINRFPENYEEFNFATMLSGKGTNIFLDIRDHYKYCKDFTPYFDACMEQSQNMNQIGTYAFKCYTLLAEGRKALSPETGRVMDYEHLTSLLT